MGSYLLLLIPFTVFLIVIEVTDGNVTPKTKLNVTFFGSGKGKSKVNIAPKELLDLGDDEDLEEDDEETLSDGRRLVSSTIVIHGYPLWDGDLVFEEDDSEEIEWSLSGDEDFREDLDDRVAPLLPSLANLNKSVSLNLCQNRWKLFNNKTTIVESEIERYVYYDEESDVVTMADDIQMWNDLNEAQTYYCLVDIINKTLIYAVYDMQSGITVIGGNAGIGKRQFDIDVQVYDPKLCTLANDADTINVYDVKSSTDEDSGDLVNFDCSLGIRDQTNGGYGVAADCYDYVIQTQKCLAIHANFTNLKSIGPSDKINVYVHYGSNLENAFWNGQGIYFGDGADTEYPSCSSMDGVAHELGHGITEKFSGLIYEKESGCMNEAFSDMTAMMVRVCVRGSTNWLFDLDVQKNSDAVSNEMIRNMKKAASDSQQIKKYSEYDDTVDVHVCSGIYNYVFYKISTLPGWDIFKAYRIFFGANRMYWKQDSTMASGACGVVQYAQEIRYSSSDIKQIVDTFLSVGIRIKDCSALAVQNTPIGTTPRPKPALTTTTLPTTTKQPFTTTASDEEGDVQKVDDDDEDEEEEHIEIYGLTNCRTLYGIYGQEGDTDYYKLVIPPPIKKAAPTKLVVTLRADESDLESNADLYIKYGDLPESLSDYDVGGHVDGSVITAEISCPPDGDYYVIVHGYDDYEDLDLNACYVSDKATEC